MTRKGRERYSSWREDARCKGMDGEIFFPNTSSPYAYDDAREICGWCPVASECLQYANEMQIGWGMWGGRTPTERYPDRNDRRSAQAGGVSLPVPHGTESGAQWHARNGEKACEPCAQARRQAVNDRKARLRERARQGTP